MRLRLGVGALLLIWLLLGHLSAQAQFRKTPWPKRAPTPALDFLATPSTPPTPSKPLVPAPRGVPILLNFWATWCAPCKEELPTLQTLHDISDSSTLVLSVNVREPALRVARYVQATGLTFPVMLDPKGDLAKRWGVTVFPTTVLIGPDGQARWRVMGDVDWSGRDAQTWLTQLAQVPRLQAPAFAPKR